MIRPFTSAEFFYLLYAVRWTLALSVIAFAGGAIGGLAIALAFALGVAASVFYESGTYDFSATKSIFAGSSGDIAPTSPPNGGSEARGNHLK